MRVTIWPIRSHFVEADEDTSFLLFGVTAISTVSPFSLRDALPICPGHATGTGYRPGGGDRRPPVRDGRRSPPTDRKSTRLNSSHVDSSYAAFCSSRKAPKT